MSEYVPFRPAATGIRSILLIRIVVFGNDFADTVWDFRNKGIAHAEGTMSIGHSVVGPAFREALKLVQLVGDESS